MRFAATSRAANAFRELTPLRLALTILFMGFFIFFSELSVIGQTLPKATVCEQGVISLPNNQSLAPVYVIDLSSMTFESDHEMISFCASFITDEYVLRANPDTQEAVLMLQMKGRTNWTIQEWNGLLQSRCENKPLLK